MLHDVMTVESLGDHRLRVRFDDGTEGVVDVKQIVRFDGVFEPLRDQTFFAQVSVNPVLGTICWPNGTNLDSDVLYAVVAHRMEFEKGVPVLPRRPGAPTVTVEDVDRLSEDDL